MSLSSCSSHKSRVHSFACCTFGNWSNSWWNYRLSGRNSIRHNWMFLWSCCKSIHPLGWLFLWWSKYSRMRIIQCMTLLSEDSSKEGIFPVLALCKTLNRSFWAQPPRRMALLLSWVAWWKSYNIYITILHIGTILSSSLLTNPIFYKSFVIFNQFSKYHRKIYLW